jgi:branched-chain amino acid aminotransferase
MLVLINNEFVAEKKASLPLTQSILWGFGIFETLRTYRNRAFFRIEDHMSRLFDSAEQIGLAIPYGKEEILEMLKKIARRSAHEIQRIKIVAIPECIIITSTEYEESKEIYNGVECLSVICQRSLPQIKSISYLPSIVSHNKAEQEGCFDAILLDNSGEVYEGAFSNIFWFEDDILCTRKDKVLPGIMRKVILEISPFEMEYKTIRIQDLYEMREIFLTSSVKGIVPVVGIDRRQIGDGVPGKNTAQLRSILASHVP